MLDPRDGATKLNTSEYQEKEKKKRKEYQQDQKPQKSFLMRRRPILRCHHDLQPLCERPPNSQKYETRLIVNAAVRHAA